MADPEKRLINSLTPSKEEREILGILLRKYAINYVLESKSENHSRVYTVNYKDEDIAVQLSNTIIKHERKKQNEKKGKVEYRYNVLKTSPPALPEHQSGAFGTVHKVAKTLILPTDGPIIVKEKNKLKRRVVKRQSLMADKQNSFDQKRKIAEKETENIQHLPHLHGKKGIKFFSSTGRFEYIIIERKMPGHNLEYLLDRHRKTVCNTSPLFPDKTLFALFKAAVKALKEQFHDQGYLHRDVKNANVMYDHATGTVNFIDPGLSRKITQYEDDNVGALGYVAPEVILGESQNEKSDLYSLAIVLIELWGGKGREDFISANEIIRKSYSYVKDIPLCPLDIKNLLADMTRFTRDDRPSAEEILKRLNEIEERNQNLKTNLETSDSSPSLHRSILGCC